MTCLEIDLDRENFFKKPLISLAFRGTLLA
jgi:hypothetical protein